MSKRKILGFGALWALGAVVWAPILIYVARMWWWLVVAAATNPDCWLFPVGGACPS